MYLSQGMRSEQRPGGRRGQFHFLSGCRNINTNHGKHYLGNIITNHGKDYLRNIITKHAKDYLKNIITKHGKHYIKCVHPL